MRILIYFEQFSWGGVDTHLLTLLKEWPEKRDEIVVLSNTGNAGFSRIKVELDKLKHVETVEIKGLSHSVLMNAFNKNRASRLLRPFFHIMLPLTYILSILFFIRVIKKLGTFDVILGDNGGYPGAWGIFSLLEASKILGVPARMMLVHHAATKPLPFTSWFENIIDYRLSKLISALISVSNATKKSLLMSRSINSERINMPVIHNQVSPSESQSNFDFREFLSLPNGVLLIGIIGRVERYKGHLDLITALGTLPKLYLEKLHIVVVGSGEEMEVNALKDFAAAYGVNENVHFSGYLDEPSSCLIEQLDLCAMLTRSFEGFGLTIIEAMQVGTPVLATDVGAVSEFLDEKSGKIIQPSAPGAIAAALKELVDNPDIYSKRATYAKAKVPKNAKEMAKSYRLMMNAVCLAPK